ncbi:MAG: histidine kinase, partial [Saprospiraceae bacterium]|nr:histidine kinase [Saprospiraceae bacterium]
GAAAANILGGMFNRILKLYWLVPDYFPDSTIKYWDYRMVYDIFDCVLASCIALSIRMYFRYQEQQKREAALLLEKSAAELRALRSQIQPHFLFNTINNLYVLARNKSDKTAPLALKLAGLLRYVLYESADKTVSISKEIALIKDYVDMEQLRFDEDRLRLSLNTQVDNSEQPVAPLLLLPLVENAFKHGASEQADEAQIRIDIVLKNGQLDVRVENTCAETLTDQPVGIGLENLRRQLELLYPGKYRLDVQRQQRLFIAHLQIEL